MAFQAFCCLLLLPIIEVFTRYTVHVLTCIYVNVFMSSSTCFKWRIRLFMWHHIVTSHPLSGLCVGISFYLNVTTSRIAPPPCTCSPAHCYQSNSNQSDPKEAGGSIKGCFNSHSSAHSWLDFPACISELYGTVVG